MTVAKVAIVGAEGTRDVELLVDTGSLYTWVAGETLSLVGARLLGKRSFRTIEGREIVRSVGEAMLKVEGEQATRIVVYAEPGDAEVLGADSLEGLGFEVDPTSKRLKKVEAFIAY